MARQKQGAQLARWMMFVDGEGFAMRGRELLHQRRIEPLPGALFEPDVFLWFSGCAPRTVFDPLHAAPIEQYALRWHYYSALQGDNEKVDSVRDRLLALGFDPRIFKKVAKKKSKGVDISLAKDFLGHAYRDDYDAAVLVAGDGDFVPLVEDVKRLGKQVFVMFFKGEGLGLSEELRRSADGFFDFSSFFTQCWQNRPDKRDWDNESAA